MRAFLLTFLLTFPLASASSPAADLPTLFESSGIVGMSVATVADGEVASLRHFGVRNADTSVAVDDATVFEAASLTKTVVAYTALRLLDRGEIALDDPLLDRIEAPRLANDPLAPTITVRMALSHTSGLPNWGGDPLERNFEPGTGWGYSGEGYVLLGEFLEAVSGLRLDDLVRRECFGPLGMTSSGLIWRPLYDDVTATGHDQIGAAVDKQQPTDENAAASLHTTAADYARFLAAVLEGRGLEPSTAKTMLTPVATVQGWGDGDAAARLRWGLGWGLQPTSDDGWSIWHWGDNGVFRCFVWGDPTTRRGVVYFTNSQVGLGIVEDLLALYTDDEPWSIRWLDYTRWDDPASVARIAVRRAFVEGGVETGWAKIREFETAQGAEVPEDEILSVAGFLRDRDADDVALGLLERLESERPSAVVYRTLGETRTNTGDHEAALADLERAIALDDSLAADLAPRVAWLRDGLTRERVELSAAEMARFAGSYGPRVITLDEGTLYYAREGATQRSRLVPLSNAHFALEGVPWFRLRIETDAEGRGIAAIGLYSDGRSDRTE